MVYLPMGYLYGKRFRCEKDELVESLREVSSRGGRRGGGEKRREEMGRGSILLTLLS